MRIRVQIPRPLLLSQLLWQRTVCGSDQLACHSNVHSSEQETSPLTGWEVKVDTCHCPNLHRQHTEHLCVRVCCVYVRMYARTAYPMCIPTFKKSGWVPLVSFLVFSCLDFIWTPLMGGRSANRWFQPLYFWSLFCPVLAPLSESPAGFWSGWDILAHHLLVPWVPGHPLFIWTTPQEECLNVEAASDMSEAAGSGHLWVVISNLLENSYLFPISLPITGLFVDGHPPKPHAVFFSSVTFA